ncbi:MAG: Lrp/AsnC ligand binding domain-containing protein [Acidimicrobiales bacterium]|nr:Lrp/AsnC ligand binding domain-containing protein [Acidimicrobiales bacterium]
MIRAFVLINARADRIKALGPELADLEGVVEAHSIAGHIDLVAVVAAPSHEAIADIVTGAISVLDGIEHTETLISFRAYSSAELDAAFDGME